jgi:hypothetical protein
VVLRELKEKFLGFRYNKYSTKFNIITADFGKFSNSTGRYF